MTADSAPSTTYSAPRGYPSIMIDTAAARDMFTLKLRIRELEAAVLAKQEAVIVAAFEAGQRPAAIARDLGAVLDDMGVPPDDRHGLGATQPNVRWVLNAHRRASPTPRSDKADLGVPGAGEVDLGPTRDTR